MAVVMRELDSCVTGTHGLNEDIGRYSDRDGGELNAHCVVLSVRV